MPRNPSIKTVLVIGSGPIVVGQACEFDYAGAQACKALKEEGCKVIILNSNPASIITDNHLVDAIYIEPMIPAVVEKIFQCEQPDSLLATVGGQTALNLTKEIAELGLLQKYNVRLIGLTLDALEKAESRKRFKEEMQKIEVEVPHSFTATYLDDILDVSEQLSFPLILRCSFTLGGQGGGIAHDWEELRERCEEAFAYSEELLIEESLIGWKEYELEVMRDSSGNCIVVCGIENIDPMGVHTGDSITVSPIQTLTDKEYQLMRRQAFRVMEAIGMPSGGCNVQFAVHPKTGKMICIEVNPRVSRSSALASKATGFPIAKIATKISLGYSLNELRNEATGFPASFEPVIDYVAVKLPCFNFEKFPEADKQLSTQMKSVGEVMALGRTFKEALNKAIISLGSAPETLRSENLEERLKRPHPNRLAFIFEALRANTPLEKVYSLTQYDPWFLSQMQELVAEEKTIATHTLETVDRPLLYRWKQMGFSDETLATLLRCQAEQVTKKRWEYHFRSIYKRVDTCSGEFPTSIAYLYSTYEEECESYPTNRKKILVIGSGPNKIGQGIEFDYCCVHAVKAIRELGYESILINCNPETVSTDYDVADRLYFEPLTLEHVREVLLKEKPLGTLIQFGGQIPLNIGRELYKEGFPLLGTPFPSIDCAEDRHKFRLFAAELGIQQPLGKEVLSPEEARETARAIGFPLILRPSYVIGGEAIQIIKDESALEAYLTNGTFAPTVMEQFLEGALEVEVDALCDGKELFICGVVEQVEPTGIHSGDSMSFLSPYKLSKKQEEVLEETTRRIALSLGIIGLFNVQFAIYRDEVWVLEVNPRASRTIPLLSKTTDLPLVQLATRCILGESLKELVGDKRRADAKRLGLKLPVFPFSRLGLKDENLGPQMKSTGEVLCVGQSVEELLLKAKLYYNRDSPLFSRSVGQGQGDELCKRLLSKQNNLAN